MNGESTVTAALQPVSAWGNPTLNIIEERSRYCVQVEMENLVDGTTVLREPQCVEHASLPRLGPAATDPLRIAEGALMCNEPPRGFDEEWCSQRSRSCESDNVEWACEQRDQYGAVEPEETPSGEPITNGDGSLRSAGPLQSSSAPGWRGLAILVSFGAWPRRGRGAAVDAR